MSSNSLSEVQRVITGTLPRPGSQVMLQAAAGFFNRAQTMDVQELQARHRRRMSELQGTSRSLPSEQAAVGAGVSSNEVSRKRSLTLQGISAHARREIRESFKRRESRLDDFGRYLPPNPLPVASIPKVITASPGPAEIRALALTAPVKRSATDWLTY